MHAERDHLVTGVFPELRERIETECRRVNQNPTRLDKLRAFAGFIAGECYPLLEFGKSGICTQKKWVVLASVERPERLAGLNLRLAEQNRGAKQTVP